LRLGCGSTLATHDDADAGPILVGIFD